MGEAPQCLVIPAAGLGTRMRSVNPDLPKEMLPIAGRPAIQYAVREGVAAGIENIVIVISERKEIIREYFERREAIRRLYPQAAAEMDEIKAACGLTFVYQPEPLGESDAIGLSRGAVGDGTVAIIYPDNVYLPAPGALRMLKHAYELYGEDVNALTAVNAENAQGISNSGRVKLRHLKDDVYRIEGFVPKGSGYFSPRFEGELRTCGISITGSHVYDYIERARKKTDKEEFTDYRVRSLMLGERGLLGLRLPGRVFDVGNPAGYAMCLRHVGSE
jgi:UTP--glucose-1-phosphate uridylyltransferase